MLLSKIPSCYKERRERLYKSHPDAVFIFPAHPDMIRNSDVHHAYRQDSNFYYLSGFDEPSSFLVLTPPSKMHPTGPRMILFVAPRDPEKEMWEGERYGGEGAQAVFGADEAYNVNEFEKKLPEILLGSERVFYRMGLNPDMDRRLTAVLESHRMSQGRSGKAMMPIQDPTLPVGEMRLFKDQAEIELMRKGCQITALAHQEAMKQIRPKMNECELEALVDYLFRKEGCARLGYGSIVAGGKNAACLHYRFNNDTLRDGELVLIDAGGEYGYYSADITRTFPVGRSFSLGQAKAYDLVLKAQKSGIAMAKPGAKLPEIHKHICEVMIDGLLSLGLLKGKVSEILGSGEYKRFYPHNTSHWLGLDVHDVGLYYKDGSPRALEAGMVFTIEPGFYVQPGDTQVPAEYRNIGIRIEDDILVTATGCENLTLLAPKEREEIESLRA
jgi:Xaa-Pro aminopeptidase